MKPIMFFLVGMSFAAVSLTMDDGQYLGLKTENNWEQISMEIAKTDVHRLINKRMKELYAYLKHMPQKIEELRESIKKIENTDRNFVSDSIVESHIGRAEENLKRLNEEVNGFLASLVKIETIPDNTYNPNTLSETLHNPIELKEYEPPICCNKPKSYLSTHCFMIFCCPFWCPLYLICSPCICMHHRYEQYQIEKSTSSITDLEAIELRPKIKKDMQSYIESDEYSKKMQEATLSLSEQLNSYREELQELQDVLKNLSSHQGG